MIKKLLCSTLVVSVIILASCSENPKTNNKNNDTENLTVKLQQAETQASIACLNEKNLVETVDIIAKTQGYELGDLTKEQSCKSLIEQAKFINLNNTESKRKAISNLKIVKKALDKTSNTDYKVVISVSTNKNKVLKNQKVEIYDITEKGSLQIKVAEAITNKKGFVIFTEKDGLKYVKSYAVYVNEENQGFTFRTDIPSLFEKDFEITKYKEEDIAGDYPTDVAAATVEVNDEDSNSVKGQIVTIKSKSGFSLSQATDGKGLAIFKTGLKKGARYDIWVNGKKNGFNSLMSGNKRSVFIKPSEIIK